MKYTISGNDIFKDGNKIGQITFSGNGVKFSQALITGPAAFTLERESRSYKIIDSGVEMGKVKKGLKIDYNYTTYEADNRSAARFRGRLENTLNIESSGMVVATISRENNNYTIDCTTSGSEVPAFSVYAILSRYMNMGSTGGSTNTAFSRARRQMPGSYRAVSSVLSILALIFLYNIAGGFLIPTTYDVVVFVILLIASYVVRGLGYKKGKYQQNQEIQNQ